MTGPHLQMSAHDVLTTTRAVRRRLDFEQPVARNEIREAVQVAIQAPSGGNVQSWKWIAVEDSKIKMELAELYRKFYAGYRVHVLSGDASESGASGSSLESGDHLAANLHRAPWLVIPCITGPMGRADVSMPSFGQAMTWASIYPAVWNFQLALRMRGLVSCLTTNHLAFEREAADILGIPFETTNQAALIPVARSLGSEFRAAPRKSLDDVLTIDGW